MQRTILQLQIVQPELSLQPENLKSRSSQLKCSAIFAIYSHFCNIYKKTHWSLFLIKLQALNTYFQKYLRSVLSA